MMYLMLIVGFVLLVKGADFFVDGASDIARILRIPSVIIGLTIVAMGTSAPEAAVSITAGFAGSNDIALGNVIGSNIFNLMVVVGVCGAIKSFAADKDIINRDFPVSVGATVVLLAFIYDGSLTLTEGGILLMLMLIYICVMINSALKSRTDDSDDAKELSLLKSIAYTLVGVAAVIIGGQLVVNNAVLIAENFGLSENLIGLTIVAIGTSLPELVTSIVAAGKGNSGLALGNVVGSNIFNILFILGSSVVLNPISAGMESVIDVVIVLVLTFVVFLWCRINRNINRYVGLVMIFIYVLYSVYIFIR